MKTHSPIVGSHIPEANIKLKEGVTRVRDDVHFRLKYKKPEESEEDAGSLQDEFLFFQLVVESGERGEILTVLELFPGLPTHMLMSIDPEIDWQLLLSCLATMGDESLMSSRLNSIVTQHASVTFEKWDNDTDIEVTIEGVIIGNQLPTFEAETFLIF